MLIAFIGWIFGIHNNWLVIGIVVLGGVTLFLNFKKRPNKEFGKFRNIFFLLMAVLFLGLVTSQLLKQEIYLWYSLIFYSVYFFYVFYFEKASKKLGHKNIFNKVKFFVVGYVIFSFCALYVLKNQLPSIFSRLSIDFPFVFLSALYISKAYLKTSFRKIGKSVVFDKGMEPVELINI